MADQTAEPVTVAALYRFARVDAPEAKRKPLAALCCGLGIKGTLILASEGINGTVAGTADAIARLLAHLMAWPGMAELDVKYSAAAEMPFRRMKVKLRREIVTMGVAGMDPLAAAGTYVEPADWNALIADPGTVVIDTRNDYEVRVGTFAGAVDPQTTSFAEFPAWLEARREDLAGKRLAMFCTGGIRCEKATAYARSLGLDEVYHLKGGILRYLEQVPEMESRWQGECFVFDDRVAVGHGLTEGATELCRACRRPLDAADKASPLYEEGVSCPRCHGERSDADRARYAERQRQMTLAARRSG